MGTAERCDHQGCGARGLIRAEYVTGSLFFCGHHWRAVAPAAAKTALIVIDERDSAADPVPQAA